MIDLQNLLTIELPSVKSLAFPTTVQELKDEDERDQRQIIKEAFAGDDVIRDFLKEKREAVEVSKPKDLDLTLPGWGEWGGMGLKPRAKKRHQFLIKAPEGPPRKDKNLSNVIINEKRNSFAAAHQVQVLPHPFTHHQQFERTIQTPMGFTWNIQRAFQKLTMPKVVTKPGHIIKPIKAEDVGYRSSSRDGDQGAVTLALGPSAMQFTVEQMEDALPSGVAMAAWASSCGDFAVFHECLGFPESPQTQNRLCSCSPLAFPEQMCPGAQL
ncbi:hypothetical protein MJG53_008935 [Ovis ammon polii x Ovis aries]|uniref:Uncharacterized protein n=1 Tax=Ovis ammon polii x Ovis aries TaxID=2918886 RepID=A0ACB9UYE7_9CETA|nr:hypothetical protein MJT46_008569 [Ovis ammon polii x Ovis aries]KAI4582384.1 hypothetical protein MJG53_008935 [Ovis ammon polii x Ovis aries]